THSKQESGISHSPYPPKHPS
ncbi:nucleosome assembly protein, partial [Histoplasma capsulatum]